ncbi:TetR/AcrR family transcriptional regulator [Microbispora hainanensis]|uniref:TetR/AcrR family transcriptional regulator n=1 Tax=Microbispora hainanensis TaxID=568844 RepID=UPI0033E53DFB
MNSPSDLQRSGRMRADARRNHERLLTAAVSAFSRHGVNASLDDIASQAGVGSATLYRHFPTRQVLVETVLEDRVDALCLRARQLLDEPSPVGALREWLVAVVEHSRTYRGLAAAQMALEISDTTDSDQIREAGEALLVRARKAGAVRPDIDVTDLLRLVNAVAWASEHTSAPSEQGERLLAIVIEGVQSRDPDRGERADT